MSCPKCNHPTPVPVTQDENKLYCPKCKHAWDKKSGPKEGSLQFDGIPQAKQFIDLIMQNQEIAAPNKAALVAQLVAGFYDQWFEGFKAGLIADIIYQYDNKLLSKENSNGKDSIGQQREDREHQSGNSIPGVRHDQDSISGNASSEPKGSTGRVRELITGVEVHRPANLTLSDSQYEWLGSSIQAWKDAGMKLTRVLYDGRTASFETSV